MRISICVIVCLVSSILVFSQGVRTIRGKVTDASTRQPLSFAQICLSGTTIGTVTNEEDFFRLSVPDDGYADNGYADTLMVTFLGLKLKKF